MIEIDIIGMIYNEVYECNRCEYMTNDDICLIHSYWEILYKKYYQRGTTQDIILITRMLDCSFEHVPVCLKQNDDKQTGHEIHRRWDKKIKIEPKIDSLLNLLALIF